MNLFINTISNPGIIILFEENNKIIDNLELDFTKNESSKLIPNITKILKNNKIDYTDLKNIIVVNGPGSFTGVRSTILTINSINFIIKKNITTLTFFDLFDNYPIIKKSSKRDSFIKIDKNSKIKILDNDEIIKILKQKNINTIYGDLDKKIFENFKIINSINYEKILKNLTYSKLKFAESNYIKKPSIT